MELNNSSLYHYQPLKQDEIRLLEVRSAEDGSPTAKLRTFVLGRKGCPSFKALSYVWGDPIERWPLPIGPHQLPVLQSLKPFLEFIQTRPDTRNTWWWIDSICINEHDMQERAKQVQLMGQIYRQARETIVWLGPAADDSDDAVAFLQRLAAKRHYASLQASKDEKEQARIMAAACVTDEDTPQWVAIERFFRRPWWTRVWTVQEFILSKQVLFYCGSVCLTRNTFSSALYAIWLCSYGTELPVDSSAWNPAWSRRRLLQWFKQHGGRKLKDSGPIPLVAMLAFFCDHDASVDQDRIYSLLGLAADSKKLIPETRYDTPILDTYTGLTVRFIEQYGSLDIICFSHIFGNDRAPRVSSEFPSWVPDWRVKPYPLVVPMMVSQGSGHFIGNLRPVHTAVVSAVYSASGDSPARAVYLSPHKLECEGVIIDVIDGLSACVSNDESEGQLASLSQSTSAANHPRATSRSASQSFANALELLYAICRSLVLDRQDRYFCHPADIQRFSLDFSLFCTSVLASPSSADRRFSDWFALNKKLRLRGYSLEYLAKQICAKMPDVPLDLFDVSNWESFLSRFCDTTIKMARRLATTGEGLVVMAPLRAQKGDIVCVLFGCSVPVVLRKDERFSEYKFVGECYVDEYMTGRAMERIESGELSPTSFLMS